MEEDIEETGNQPKSSTDHLKPWQFKPGQSGNPSGKPKGTVSLKEYAKRMLREMSEDEKIEFMKGLDKDVIWKMSEGNPHQTSEGNLKVDSSPIIIRYDRYNKDISRLPVDDTGREGTVHSGDSGSPVGEDNSGSSLDGQGDRT